MEQKQDIIQHFKNIIWNYYKQNKREFIWRETTDPYHIVVSEIMLQQTQTTRVQEKYPPFIKMFPTWKDLAYAPLHVLLSYWQGLGYNRRALALQRIAQKVLHEYDGVTPTDPSILVSFPGIGPNTAGSICAFAYNMPTIFIETNIRTVFIEHFFQQKITISDKEIVPLLEQSLDHTNSREWYYALMDYGAMLKKTRPNPSRKSIHHTKQSKFKGSDRQIRGAILKLLIQYRTLSYTDLFSMLPQEKTRIEKMVTNLEKEHFITINQTLLSIR
jgi:A/G-specific adenine glycosylase